MAMGGFNFNRPMLGLRGTLSGSTMPSTSSLQQKDSLKDFTKADDFSDAVLTVEGKDLHVHMVYLAEWSPVFKQMFVSSSKKKKKYRLALKNKKYQHILELLHCIYSSQKAITNDNVHYLLQLAEEFEIKKVTERCEQFLLTSEPSIQSLVLGQRYELPALHNHAIDFLKRLVVSQIENDPDYPMLGQGTLSCLYKSRAEYLETVLKNIHDCCIDGADRCEMHRDFNYFPNGCYGCVQHAMNKVTDICNETIKELIHPTMIVFKGTHFAMHKNLESNT